MNEDVKMYIPYGAAALGGFVGNWLFNKYPKFGMVGKLVAIAGGVAGGYYISKTILGEKVELPFKNAVSGSDSKNCTKRNCYPHEPYIDSNGKCVCLVKRSLKDSEFSNFVNGQRLWKCDSAGRPRCYEYNNGFFDDLPNRMCGEKPLDLKCGSSRTSGGRTM